MLDVLAVEEERLAGRALTFLAAVHEHDTLLEGRPQDRLILVRLDLDAYRLEPHDVLFAHDSLMHLRLRVLLPCQAGPMRPGRAEGRAWSGGPRPPPLRSYLRLPMRCLVPVRRPQVPDVRPGPGGCSPP